MKRETQHVLLLLLGGALLRIAADDTFLRYVRPSHRWPLLVAGAVMALLAVIALVRDRRGARAGVHEHPAAERHAPWLLLQPVLVIALVAPPALGADSVTRAGTSSAVLRDADVFGPLAPGEAPDLPVMEFVQRAMFDHTGTLDGHDVTLTGFVVRRGAAVELARLTISCCAADARPARVRLRGGELDAVTQDTWLRVRGTLVPGSATPAEHYVPAMVVRGVEVVAAPPDPYEY